MLPSKFCPTAALAAALSQLGFAVFLGNVVWCLPASGSESKLVYADDFERSELGPGLRSPIPDFRVEGGLLKGRQVKAEHGGTLHRKLDLPGGDVVVELKFRFAGARSFSLACDDVAFKGSHAGHISRLVVQRNKLKLFDDVNGVMRLDIRKMRKSGDPAQVSEGDRLAADAIASFPVELAAQQWYQLKLEIIGERMRVFIDGREVGTLTSSGLAHRTKPDFRMSAWAGKREQEVHFDELRVFSMVTSDDPKMKEVAPKLEQQDSPPHKLNTRTSN